MFIGVFDDVGKETLDGDCSIVVRSGFFSFVFHSVEGSMKREM
jgi:hypothetical protein